MKIHLVRTFDYDDETIHGAYSARELAEEAAKRYGTTGVEEVDLDAALPELNQGRYAMSVVINHGAHASYRDVRNADNGVTGYVDRLGRVIVDLFAATEDEAKAIALAAEPKIREMEAARKALVDRAHSTNVFTITREDIIGK